MEAPQLIDICGPDPTDVGNLSADFQERVSITAGIITTPGLKAPL